MGIFVVEYDNESFITFMPNPNYTGEQDYLLFSNFYSKSEAKVNVMNKEKVLEFVMSL